MKVFLSGSTNAIWQDRVIARCPENVTWFDPRTLSTQPMRDIALTERQWLDDCDIVFLYLDPSNPSGLGSAFEVGYAFAYGKHILFVDEQQTEHTRWLASHCAETVTSLEDGIQALEALLARGDAIVTDPSAEAAELLRRFEDHDMTPLRPLLAQQVAEEFGRLIRDNRAYYEDLLLATRTLPVRNYDCNLGYMVPQMQPDILAPLLVRYGDILLASEGLSWGLGELGSEDDRIIDFLYMVCECCENYDAWWCAADALEKLRAGIATDILKRTLPHAPSDDAWSSLDHCFAHLEQRPARIGILRLANYENTESEIVPRLVEALELSEERVVESAIWILERLRVSEPSLLRRLHDLYGRAEDVGHSLRPRVAEALGAIADARSRSLLEEALTSAEYFRTRAYAAQGLGLIGKPESLAVLDRQFAVEEDPRVIQYISEAIQEIQDPDRRALNELRRTAGWPENGMIVDETNKWYANPEIYETFSNAEDPEEIAFRYALSLIPPGGTSVLDIGTGTGRFARLIESEVSGVDRVVAFDIQQEMLKFLAEKVRAEGGPLLVRGDATELPFGDESFDAVVSSWGFPSDMWDREMCRLQVAEVKRVLRPAGVLITIGWDESFQDELSEMWYRFVPEPEFRRETLQEWRRRRRQKITSPRNCHLTFIKKNVRLSVRFESVLEASSVFGFLFGFDAGVWVADRGQREFSMSVGVTYDDRTKLERALSRLEAM